MRKNGSGDEMRNNNSDFAMESWRIKGAKKSSSE